MIKKILLSSLLGLAVSVSAQAKSINSSTETIAPSKIDKIVRLVDKVQQNVGSEKKLSVIVEDHGLSTDVSPRYSIYLGYSSLAEMGNITADVKVTDQAFKFVSATRKSAGIYEVVTQEYRETGMFLVTHEIDASKIFADEKKVRTECGIDFCDKALQTSIEVTETAKSL